NDVCILIVLSLDQKAARSCRSPALSPMGQKSIFCPMGAVCRISRCLQENSGKWQPEKVPPYAGTPDLQWQGWRSKRSLGRLGKSGFRIALMLKAAGAYFHVRPSPRATSQSPNKQDRYAQSSGI